MIQILIWWFAVQFLGWLTLPIAYRTFRWLPDRGYAFSKSLGLLLASYFLWLGATTGFLRNDVGGILASGLLIAGVSAWILLRSHDQDGTRLTTSISTFLNQRKNLIFTVEILFTVAFIAWAVLRAYAPYKIMPTGGEKFMEITFLNGVLNSPHFPPQDSWLSGFAISYYYFGYVMMALITRISGAAPGVGFDLYDALLFALTAVGVFGVVYNLISRGRRHFKLSVNSSGSDRQSLTYALLGAMLVVVMGNLEGFLEALRSKGVLPLSFWNWLNIPGLAEAPVTGSFYPGNANGWWWWRASRVLFDDPINKNPLNSITEFPFFSFLLGDNHPHVLALPFVLLIIALAFNLLLSHLDHPVRIQDEVSDTSWWNPIQTAFHGDWFTFFISALSIGSLGFLNTWDMPIYLGLVVLTYGVGLYAIQRHLDWLLVWRVITLGISFSISAIALYFFFYTSFSSQAGGILPFVFPPTRLPQYLVMFGIFIFILAGFLVANLVKQSKGGHRKGLLRTLLIWWGWVILASAGIFVLILLAVSVTSVGQMLIQEVLKNPSIQAAVGSLSVGEALRTVLLYKLDDPWLFLLLSFLIALLIANLIFLVKNRELVDETSEGMYFNFPASDLFVFVLIFVGLALTFSVEFFYLRDNFGVRMNTVFKFYYQGWMMMGIASGYSLWWLAARGREFLGTIARSAFALGAVLLIAAGLVYPAMSYYSRAAGFSNQPNINGASEIARDNPDDWAAIQWLRNHNSPTENGMPPVILEAPGTSYTYQGRISAFSGFPAVLGWAVHESQWRGNYIEQGKREPDIATIYTTKDGKTALELLKKWHVQYVIVGATEQEYIRNKCNDPGLTCNLSSALRKFDTTLTPVFQSGETTIYEVPGSGE
jgi:YYY domain-containing protein